MAMIVQARGVLVAPAKIATNPKAAKSSTGAPRRRARTFPKEAPMKKNGTAHGGVGFATGVDVQALSCDGVDDYVCRPP